MKDYYQILGMLDNADQEEIKSAFRKLAFTYHPDTACSDKKEAEAKFKEINEAYGVLGDPVKRQRYDFARKAGVAGYGTRYGGFSYSQQDIFQDIFANPVMFTELNRMFSQAGLRFDREFLNHVFFQNSGVLFQFSFGPGGIRQGVYRFGRKPASPPDLPPAVSAYRPNWLERLSAKILVKTGQFILGRLFGVQFEPPLAAQSEQHIELEVTPAEAASGGEKGIVHKRNGKVRKFMVKIPPGVKSGTKIQLRGAAENKERGDLYLHIKVKG